MVNSNCNYYINRTGKVVRCFDNNYLITHIIKWGQKMQWHENKKKNMNRNNTNKKILKVIV